MLGVSLHQSFTCHLTGRAEHGLKEEKKKPLQAKLGDSHAGWGG